MITPWTSAEATVTRTMTNTAMTMDTMSMKVNGGSGLQEMLMKLTKAKARANVWERYATSVAGMDTSPRTVPPRGHSKVKEEAKEIPREARGKEEK